MFKIKFKNPFALIRELRKDIDLLKTRTEVLLSCIEKLQRIEKLKCEK